jgi:HSP20 family molecular chaperone IbpA
MSEKATAVQLAKQPITVRPFAPDFFERANSIFEGISRRAYEIFEGNGHALGRDLDNWFQAERELLHPVHIQINDSGEALEVKAEVPGFNEKELSVSLEPRQLVITGKREVKKEETKGKTIYSEACASEIMRVVALPAEVDSEKVTATLKNGILELSLPKAAKAKSVKVESKAA